MNPQKIAIMTDSCTDVPQELIEKYQMYVVPMRVIYHDREYTDKVDITPQQVYDRLEEEVPHTSLPSIDTVCDALSRIEQAGYEHVIAVSISGALSGTGNAMRLAAEQFPGLDCRVIDTLNIGIGAGFQAIYAGRLIEQGLDMDEICRKIHYSVEHTHVYFCMATLEYLRKGGRIGRVASMLGSVLNLKPIISCDADGAYYVVSKARGRVKSIAETVALALKQVQGNAKYCIAVANGSAREEAAKLAQELKQRLPDAQLFLECEVSPALGVHTGPGLLGIGVQVVEG